MSEIVATLVFDDAKLRAYAERMRRDSYSGDETPPSVEQMVTELLEGWAAEMAALGFTQGFTGVVETRAEVKRG